MCQTEGRSWLLHPLLCFPPPPRLTERAPSLIFPRYLDYKAIVRYRSEVFVLDTEQLVPDSGYMALLCVSCWPPEWTQSRQSPTLVKPTRFLALMTKSEFRWWCPCSGQLLSVRSVYFGCGSLNLYTALIASDAAIWNIPPGSCSERNDSI